MHILVTTTCIFATLLHAYSRHYYMHYYPCTLLILPALPFPLRVLFVLACVLFVYSLCTLCLLCVYSVCSQATDRNEERSEQEALNREKARGEAFVSTERFKVRCSSSISLKFKLTCARAMCVAERASERAGEGACVRV